MPATSYLLPSSQVERNRLRLQAQVWEPESERLFEQIAIKPGWYCADLGCGTMGVLGPLSRRVGPSGRVLGVDNDPAQLEAASDYVAEAGLTNVALVAGDAYSTALPHGTFDLVHARFVMAPVGRGEELLREMTALAQPGGIVVIQEPDAASWGCFPSAPGWERLKRAIQVAFAAGGGDFNAGRRTYAMLQCTGLDHVQIRAAVIALPGGHPYLRLPIQFAASLRHRILDGGLMSAAELDEAVVAYTSAMVDPDSVGLSFVVTQVWGKARA
jgi:ubiquinone/menaquinone biosynthesis C-methylase UbiE